MGMTIVGWGLLTTRTTKMLVTTIMSLGSSQAQTNTGHVVATVHTQTCRNFVYRHRFSLSRSGSRDYNTCLLVIENRQTALFYGKVRVLEDAEQNANNPGEKAQKRKPTNFDNNKTQRREEGIWYLVPSVRNTYNKSVRLCTDSLKRADIVRKRLKIKREIEYVQDASSAP